MAVFIGAVKGNKSVGSVLEPTMENHKKILRFIKSLKIADEITDYTNFPDKYGNYSSEFFVTWQPKGKSYTITKQFTVYYDPKYKVVFVSMEGIQPYNNLSDIKNIIQKFLN